MKAIAFFDFDGTITTKDTFIEFIRYAKGNLKFLIGFAWLSPMLVLFKLGIIPNYRAKEYVLTWFFGGMNKEDFSAVAREYAQNCIDKIVRPEALRRIQWHQQQGNEVVIVSASIHEWIIPWSQKYNLVLISSEIEYKHHKITGKLSTPNCYGAEKVRRIKMAYDLSKFDYIYAYGDSSGDKEMLALADEKYYRRF